MPQFDIKRIFLRDEAGNHYRIASVSNPKDCKGEYYLKAMFPDIKGTPLVVRHHKGEGNVEKITGQPGGIQEYSYHYRSGVSHFKDANGYVDQKRNMPTLLNNPALHLFRYIVRSLEPFKKYENSKVAASDFVFPDVFNGRPRGFEFAVSRVAGPWNIVNEQGKAPLKTYKFPLTDQNISLHVSDGVWIRPSTPKPDALFEIFVHDDPISVFTFKPLK